MALVLDATVGAATANSYNTLVEIDAVADELLPVPQTWLDGDDDDLKNRSAVKAARLLDQETFSQARVDLTQALEWPRAYVQKMSGGYAGYQFGVYLTTEIPGPVKLAHARLTIYLHEQASDDIDPFDTIDGQGITSVSLGLGLGASFDVGSSARSAGASFMASVILPILGRLVYTRQPRTIRG